MTSLAGLVAHARHVPVAARHDLANRLRAAVPPGSVLLETCHRVELYGPFDTITALGASTPPGAVVLGRSELTRHVVELAVGRASAVIGEDQVLHQLRDAVATARANGPLPPELDRLLDRALRAGRRARTWLPAHRPSLADLALDRAAARAPDHPGPVLVVGAGRMGVLAARAARARGLEVVVASRTADRAARVAAELGVLTWPFTPSPADLGAVSGVVVALAGAWPLDAAACDALVRSGAWVADLSAPPASPARLEAGLGDRLIAIDDLIPAEHGTAPALVERLDRLIDDTVDEHERWLADGARRTAARALADRAERAREVELEALFTSLDTLDPAERAAVARMADRLTARLLRAPLERLRHDADGRHGRAARELFGL